MIARCRAAFVALMLALSAAGVVHAAPAQKTAVPAHASQILVMLRIAPQHYRPNADYGAGYGDDVYRNARRRMAARIARKHGLILVSNWPMPLVGVDCFIMAVSDKRSTDQAAAEVSHDSAVEWAQPLQLYHTMGAAAQGGDPLAPLQPATKEWRLADLHQIATRRAASPSR